MPETRPAACRPAMLWIRVTSIASVRLIAGRIEGIRRASIVLPVPGAPSNSRLWPPAAAISSASSGAAWPLTSARSGSAATAHVSTAGAGSGGGSAPGEHLRRGPETRHADDLQSADERRLTGPFARHDQSLQPGAARSFGDRQRARRVAQLAAERQLAEHRVGPERLARNLIARGEHAERERRVESRADLAQERRREVGGDPRLGELEPGVVDRRADPVSRLPHRGVSEADDRERRQAAADVDLDRHLPRIDPVDRERGDAREHRRERTRRRVTDG